MFLDLVHSVLRPNTLGTRCVLDFVTGRPSWGSYSSLQVLLLRYRLGLAAKCCGGVVDKHTLKDPVKETFKHPKGLVYQLTPYSGIRVMA